MKKLISLLLALMMVLSLATVAFAAEPGAIIITGAALNDSNKLIATYNLYKMMDVSYDGDNYSYTVVNAWRGFFDLPAIQAYFSVDSNGVVIWNEISGENTSARAAEVALLAISWAKEQHIAPDKSTATPDHSLTVENGTGTVKFEGLELGYYLVDSSVGALCGLTTTNPSVTMATKNIPPVLDKKVQEDSLANTGTSSWGSANTAGVGETVNFDSTIDIENGVHNLVYHDKMDSGLTLDPDSIKVKLYDSSENTTTDVAALDQNYEIKLASACSDGCAFEIHFVNSFAKNLSGGDKLIILYSTTVNENAVIASTGNVNEAWLDYGDNHSTTHDSTVTKLYAFDLLKTDSERNLLNDAEFELYNTLTPATDTAPATLTDIIHFVVTTDSETNIATYRVATPAEISDNSISTVTTISVDGRVRISGLDNGTYFLKETKEPEGYHRIAEPITVTIADNNNDVQFDETNKPVIGTGVQVINQSGTILPQTGATGTAMFIFFGMFVMLTTGVLLVTKKRMSMIEE